MKVKTVNSKTLKSWLDDNAAILIDVREPHEYYDTNIPGSTLIPLSDICKAALPKYGDKRIVIHCHLGGRSHFACQKLLTEDPSLDVYNLTGGIDAWIDEGNIVNQ